MTSLNLPYVSHLQRKVRPGQTLVVKGKVRENATYFAVNLLAGTPVIDDVGSVVLHVNWRNGEGGIVLNTLHNGWGKEERFKTPYKRGQDFELQISTFHNKFKITARDDVVYEYEYRMPLHTIDFVNAYGDITLREIYWCGLPFERECFKAIIIELVKNAFQHDRGMINIILGCRKHKL